MNATLNEEWRPIPGWEGMYEVSDQGRIKSLERLVRGRFGPLKVKERVTVGSVHKSTGYLRVGLYNRDVRESMHVHRAVMWHGTNAQANKTHCPKGHPYDSRNTYFDSRPDRPHKSRRCRECNKENCRRRYSAGLK